MATSKLGLYNDALLIIGERKLASLSEDVEPRYALDDAYDVSTAYCLEAGGWNFAMRAVQIDSSPSVDPAFGFTKAFAKPSDWVRSFQISGSPNLNPPLVEGEITEEAGYWYANVDPLYVKYVSNDTAYGMDLSLWPQSFASYVSAHLALKIVGRLTSSETKMKLASDAEARAARSALGKDGVSSPIAFPPRGSWVRSRMAGQNSDRGLPTGPTG